MKEISSKVDNKSNQEQYLPVQVSGGKMTCCCGYELIKYDEDTYRCTGGSHIYKLSEGDVIQDKFGNLLLKPKKLS